MSESPACIEVRGIGRVRAVPDVFVLHCEIATQSATQAGALHDAEEASNQVRDTLDKAGVAAADRRSDTLRAVPQWRWVDNSQEFDGHAVNQQLTVRLRDVDAVSVVVGEIGALESVRIAHTAWELSDTTDVDDRARRGAMADARLRACSYAEAEGLKLGRVISISESGRHASGPLLRGKAELAMLADPGGPELVVDPGELGFEAAVWVVWELGQS